VHSNQEMRDILVATTEEYGKEYVKKTLDLNRAYGEISRLDEIGKYGVPIGWSNKRLVPVTFYEWISKITGWLITAGIVSILAAFLFDWLNKFMVIRSTIKPWEKGPYPLPVPIE
jgi:hypothetical protein